jgi:3'-phosphoadenosine 5'-phosphosulfate sulfotransferase (PAPS reductase)/FAD synthetase
MLTKEEEPIEYWRNLYSLHSTLKEYKKKVENSKEIIAEFLTLSKLETRVNWSGGKDSTVLAHLVNSIAKTKVLSEKDDMDFPNELEYVKSTAALYGWDLDIITPDVKLWDIIKEHDFTEDIHSSGTDFSDKYFYGLISEYQKANNVNVYF